MTRRVGAGEVVAIYGRRGAGKTTRARAMVDGCRRLVVFDPMDEYSSAAGCRKIGNLAELKRAMRLGWRQGFRLALPCDRAWPARLHALCLLLWQAQEPASAPPLWLVVDELSLSYPARPLPDQLWGMPRLVLQGRHRRIGIVGIAQRPAQVSADFRGNVHRLVTFALPSSIDRQVVLQQLGAERAAELAALEPHNFLELDHQTGKVRRGANQGHGAIRTYRGRRARTPRLTGN